MIFSLFRKSNKEDQPEVDVQQSADNSEELMQPSDSSAPESPEDSSSAQPHEVNTESNAAPDDSASVDVKDSVPDPVPSAAPNTPPMPRVIVPLDPSQPPAKGLESEVVAALRTVFDPEIPVNIYDIGLVYEIDLKTPGRVGIAMTLTSPNCPEAESIPIHVEHVIRRIAGVEDVSVEIVWEPMWTPDMLTEAARLELGMF